MQQLEPNKSVLSFLEGWRKHKLFVHVMYLVLKEPHLGVGLVWPRLFIGLPRVFHWFSRGFSLFFSSILVFSLSYIGFAKTFLVYSLVSCFKLVSPR